MATRRRGTPPPPNDDFDDAIDDAPEIELPQFTNRKSEELSAAMQARVNGIPRFKYPPELPQQYRPYWIELVNSFPKDHFQDADLPLLKLYCRAAFDIERLDRLIEEEGDVVMGGRGVILNPRVKARSIAENVLLSISTKFRAQPASRVNTENYKGRQGKAAAGNRGAERIGESDGLLAGHSPGPH